MYKVLGLFSLGNAHVIILEYIVIYCSVMKPLFQYKFVKVLYTILEQYLQ